jgi:hypothetical protein
VYILNLFLILTVFISSCSKETSCENCIESVKPPIADAGPDQVTALPKDSTVLDGTGSKDVDGKIVSYKWTKITGGPTSIVLIDSAKTKVRGLKKGVYSFELKVKDNQGLVDADTMQLTVDTTVFVNHAPVANAGSDQVMIWPWNSAIIDGTNSTDPDSNIVSYKWVKIAGPSSFNIVNANIAQTPVTSLVEGTYTFELTVTDAQGLWSKDTMQVFVKSNTIPLPPATNPCDNTLREQVRAQLTPVGNLSMPRDGCAVATLGNKIFFAGGFSTAPNAIFTSRVDIYDVSTNSWTSAELSEARIEMATAVLNNKVYFAGGESSTGFSSRVDIYDATTNTWTKAELSHPRALLAGAAAGNKVVFAGGYGYYAPAPPVDIYDAATNTWSTDFLKDRHTSGIVGDAGIAATVIGNKIYFAGNASDWLAWDFGSITSTINVYDAVANTWSTSDLSIARGFMGSIAVGNNNYWAGGVSDQSNNYTTLVEIRDMTSGNSTFSCLHRPNAFMSVAKTNNKLVFFTLNPSKPVSWTDTGWENKGNTFDILDLSTGTWSVGVLPFLMKYATIISVNDVLYVVNNGQLWKLQF